jgi:acetate CoA-transferase
VHKFNNKIMGTGGFIDICQNTKKVVFCGTLKAGGLKESVKEGKLFIDTEGKVKKFVNATDEITFNGAEAIKNGQEVIYVTERAVFILTKEGLVLTEIAPGVDLQRDVLSQMGFEVKVSDELKKMDARLFNDGKMGIREEFMSKC